MLSVLPSSAELRHLLLHSEVPLSERLGWLETLGSAHVLRAILTPGSAGTAVMGLLSAYTGLRAGELRGALRQGAARWAELDGILRTSELPPQDAARLAATADALAARLPGLASDARGLTAIRTLVKLTAGRVFLALGFAQDLVQHHDLTQAAGDTGLSAGGALLGLRVGLVGCPPLGGPWGKAICVAGTSLAGAVGGAAVAHQLQGEFQRINHELESDFKTLSEPVGGDGLLSGVTPLEAVNPG